MNKWQFAFLIISISTAICTRDGMAESYRYMDSAGNIIFAERLEQVPERYRNQILGLRPTPIIVRDSRKEEAERKAEEQERKKKEDEEKKRQQEIKKQQSAAAKLGSFMKSNSKSSSPSLAGSLAGSPTPSSGMDIPAAVQTIQSDAAQQQSEALEKIQ